MFWSGNFALVPYKIWDNPEGGHIVARYTDTETEIAYVVAVFEDRPEKTVIYYA